MEQTPDNLRTYGFSVSRNRLYRRLRPKQGRTERFTSVRLPVSARDALIERAADRRTRSTYGYCLPGSGKGLGLYLAAVCHLWRRTGEKDTGTSDGDLNGLFDNRPAILRELDVFGPVHLGRDGIFTAMYSYKDGGVVEDAWGMFRWGYNDLNILADFLAQFFPIWSPYDVPRLPILQTLIPPDYREDQTTLEEWRSACAEFYRTPPLPESYGIRGISKYGGIGGALAQTTINLSPADKATLAQIGATYQIVDRDTLLTALACGWLSHAQLPGGTAIDRSEPDFKIY